MRQVDEMEKKLKTLEEKLNYSFKDKKNLTIALTHTSYANENKLGIISSNERLEFLGDAILNLIVSQYLYKKYPNYSEGELTKIRAKVVCESSLAYVAREICVGDYLLLGKGEESTGGRERESILADTTEAIIGAVYMDSDFKTTNECLLDKFEKDIVKAVANGDLFSDYKTELQEKYQKQANSKIKYSILKEEGPEHDKIFFMNVFFNEKLLGSGKGRNKKEAEQMAAKQALSLLGDQNE
ncbi:ribonuclease III [Tissierella creatinophila]|uniref:Ribonuclease 3 n=1 Tax=Tissierella creatinophila DSM 6911 TaxID=1123403 RepID=A0A1U7M341_TISCR|nr:ribonuclease III [Tissierella creatinophila]OLS01732.1 ribonuclease 3 [Tissierella creatinophila DSM 6911]